jgi:hypothetical protein
MAPELRSCARGDVTQSSVGVRRYGNLHRREQWRYEKRSIFSITPETDHRYRGAVVPSRRLHLRPAYLSIAPDEIQQVSINLLAAANGQIGAVAPLGDGAPNDPPQAEPPRTFERYDGFGAWQPNVECPRCEISFTDPRFTTMRCRDTRAELGQARLLPTGQIIEHVKMHDREAELPRELAGQSRLTAAGAANDDDTSRRHSRSQRSTRQSALSSRHADAASVAAHQ